MNYGCSLYDSWREEMPFMRGYVLLKPSLFVLRLEWQERLFAFDAIN